MTDVRLATRKPPYFEAIYAANSDPWNFLTSPYEHQKYAKSLEVLGGRRFSRGLEVGCSIGVFTRLLADSCDDLLGVDIAEQAIAQAISRCADKSHVKVERMQVPQAWPPGIFDLIVLSEILYFLCPADIQRLATLAGDSLEPGGLILLVNYTKPIDEPCSGQEAAEIFMGHVLSTCSNVAHVRAESFQIDMMKKRF